MLKQSRAQSPAPDGPLLPPDHDQVDAPVPSERADADVAARGGISDSEGLWIAFFWLQLERILYHSLSAIPRMSSTTSASANWLSFDVLEEVLSFQPFALECVWVSFDFVARFWLLMTLTASLALLLILHRCHCFRYARKDVAIEFLQSLLNIAYFPSVLTIIQVMPCQSQASFTYLCAAPYVSCGSTQRTAMVRSVCVNLSTVLPLLSFCCLP